MEHTELELRQYWQILVDRAVVVIATFLVALVVGAASVYMIPQVAAPYQASLVLAVAPRPEPKTGDYYSYDSYYAYVASEYFNDDLINVLESSDFMQTIRAQLQGYPGGAPSGSILGKKAHRIVTLTISSPTAAGAVALGKAVEDYLTSPAARTQLYDKINSQQEPTVSIISQPQIIAGPTGRHALLDVAARALVGLVVGVGLAFLLEYLDDSVRPGDVQRLYGLSVVGEIPGRGVPEPAKK